MTNNIQQTNTRYSNLRSSNPHVQDIPMYRSRRSSFKSPECKVKSQRLCYPSSQGFQPHLAAYTPPFGNMRGATNTSQRNNNKSNKSGKKDGNRNSVARYGRSFSPPHSSSPFSPSSPSSSNGSYLDETSNDGSTDSSMGRDGEIHTNFKMATFLNFPL